MNVMLDRVGLSLHAEAVKPTVGVGCSQWDKVSLSQLVIIVPNKTLFIQNL